MSKSKKLYRVKIEIDTLVYLSEEDASDGNVVIDSCEDAFENDSEQLSLNIKEIDWNKNVVAQIPAGFAHPLMIPENGGLTIAEIASNNNHTEEWISFGKPHVDNIV